MNPAPVAAVTEAAQGGATGGPTGRAPSSRLASFLKTRELSTLFILVAEIAFFAWYLWPEGGGRHPFFNAENGLLILKYSAIYGIAAIGASMVIISGGVDLAPGAVIALTTVVLGHQYLEAGWSLPASIMAGLGVGALAGAISSALVVLVRLPPFIATLGVMGITRGLAYIVTEGRFFDVSARIPPNWAPLGIPLDWMAPVVMVILTLVFHVFMRHVQAGRAVFAVGGNETAARYTGIDVGRIKTMVYMVSGVLAALSGVILVLGQGQGKADLANGYELDIIASAVVGGASLTGGRGSVVGAVLGTLIFGVLRNALPQIPGATFYDRLIVGLVVVVIVVVDQLLAKRRD
jgi:ribose/xylose/arabinose/galactoside ABC-type transport system permease subunit